MKRHGGRRINWDIMSLDLLIGIMIVLSLVWASQQAVAP